MPNALTFPIGPSGYKQRPQEVWLENLGQGESEGGTAGVRRVMSDSGLGDLTSRASVSLVKKKWLMRTAPPELVCLCGGPGFGFGLSSEGRSGEQVPRCPDGRVTKAWGRWRTAPCQDHGYIPI